MSGGRWAGLGPTLSGDAPEVYPLDDIAEHRIGDEDCPCRPFWDGGVLVHQSFDGREKSEGPLQ